MLTDHIATRSTEELERLLEEPTRSKARDVLAIRRAIRAELQRRSAQTDDGPEALRALFRP